MTLFYLIRHGEPLWSLNELKIVVAGRRDLVPLTEVGIKQAERVAKDTRLIDVDIILSSPYTRALQTAATINREISVPILVQYDLHEWIPDKDWAFNSLDELNGYVDDYVNNAGIYPNGETKCWEETEALKTRVNKVLNEYTHFSKVIVVCHEMVIKCIGNHNQVSYCEIIEYEIND